MPTHRFPVFLWQDPAGAHTAIPIDFEDESAGFGNSASAALDDLRTFLQWRFDRDPWRAGPDFHEPQLETFKVSIRPEYETDHRIYPCEKPVLLRVHCVSGRQESGLRVAALPLLGVRFYYHDAGSLKSLVQRYVQQQLEGKTPEELARFLAPAVVRLEEVVVRVPRARQTRAEQDAPPTLAQVAEPLGERALRKQFARAWEREAELALLVRKLHRERANVLLVGEPGVGKTTLLVEAVRAVERAAAEEADAEEARHPRRFWQTSAARLIAGMKYLGQWEQRCEEVVAELGEIHGVLCIDRLLDLLRTGGVGAGDSVAAFLLPYLQRGELRMAAEATPAELDACRRLLPGLADLFQIVPVPAFNRAQALTVLDRLLAGGKQNFRVEVADGVSDRVVQLFRRFAPYQAFPGPAVGFTRDLIDRSVRAKRPEITPADVVEQFMARTGLPELFLRDEIRLERSEVLEAFRTQVIDQEEACAAAADLVMTFKAGLNDPSRPVGVLLFCGPTGVGKTEMAQAIARYFFGHAESAERGARSAEREETGSSSLRAPRSALRAPLIRLDMSEYAGFDAVDRLLGPPNGEPSELVRKVRQQPFVVLLLDEIEKAGPEVFDVLLGVFDEGRLTDRFGRVTTFRSAIILMTSNLGAEKQSAFGFDATGERARPRYRDEAMAFFRPEFFNRLDGVVTFQPLRPETIRAITRKELEAVGRREGVARGGLRLRWGERLVERLAKAGFDARYGARPLQRTIERLVVAPLAKFLLERPGLNEAEIAADCDAAGEVRFRVAGSKPG